jgi:hypothetical protein
MLSVVTDLRNGPIGPPPGRTLVELLVQAASAVRSVRGLHTPRTMQSPSLLRPETGGSSGLALRSDPAKK